MTELPVFDPQEALRVTGNRAAIATHLLGLFLNELPEARLVITDLAGRIDPSECIEGDVGKDVRMRHSAPPVSLAEIAFQADDTSLYGAGKGG